MENSGLGPGLRTRTNQLRISVRLLLIEVISRFPYATLSHEFSRRLVRLVRGFHFRGPFSGTTVSSTISKVQRDFSPA